MPNVSGVVFTNKEKKTYFSKDVVEYGPTDAAAYLYRRKGTKA